MNFKALAVLFLSITRIAEELRHLFRVATPPGRAGRHSASLKRPSSCKVGWCHCAAAPVPSRADEACVNVAAQLAALLTGTAAPGRTGGGSQPHHGPVGYLYYHAKLI